MSYAIANWLRTYAELRERYLTGRPEKRLFPWLAGLVPEISDIEDPIIKLGPKGEEIKNMGILFLVLLGLILASRSK